MALYRLKADRLGRKAGTIVRDYHGCDYGLCSDDAYHTREPHRAVTEGPDEMATPFFTVPVSQLEPLQ